MGLRVVLDVVYNHLHASGPYSSHSVLDKVNHYEPPPPRQECCIQDAATLPARGHWVQWSPGSRCTAFWVDWLIPREPQEWSSPSTTLVAGPHCKLASVGVCEPAAVAHALLGQVVPGYYLRRAADGSVEGSTCCNNTASEHLMVERLIVDDMVLWATHYKVWGLWLLHKGWSTPRSQGSGDAGPCKRLCLEGPSACARVWKAHQRRNTS